MTQRNEGTLSGLTTKQKITGVLLVVVVLIVIWQVMGLFGGSTQTPTPAPAPRAAAPMTAGSPTAPGAPGSAVVAAGTPAMPVIQQAEQPRVPDINLDTQALEAQKKSEQKYIEQLNQLQLLKVQREIAETNQAIAAARFATVTAEKNVSDLLTRPTPQPVPAGAYGPALVGPAPAGIQLPGMPQGATGTETTQVTTVTTPTPPAEVQYVVISVTMQRGRWSAVLGYQGKLYNVAIGDVLPTDGSVVLSINRNGVVLGSKDGRRKKIGIVSSI